MNTFASTGDLGDIIASLPSVRALGGGHYRIGYRQSGQRESMRGARFDAIRPLLLAQPYIASCEWTEDFAGVTHDFSSFRSDTKIIYGESLAHWNARHLGVTISTEPWLAVPPSPKSAGRTVIARSARHHSTYRMWQKIVGKLKKEALFAGTPDEHKALSSTTGALIEYCPTKDLLDLASVIAGARLFIGNQSCPWWIACGLGVPCIQEVWAQAPNSRIEREGLRYWTEPPFDL